MSLRENTMCIAKAFDGITYSAAIWRSDINEAYECVYLIEDIEFVTFVLNRTSRSLRLSQHINRSDGAYVGRPYCANSQRILRDDIGSTYPLVRLNHFNNHTFKLHYTTHSERKYMCQVIRNT